MTPPIDPTPQNREQNQTEMSQNVPQCPGAAHLLSENEAQDVLSDRQRAALELILLGQNDSAVAEKVGVDRRTIYRWRNENETFAAELYIRRRQLWEGAVDQLRNMLVPSLEVLKEHLADSLDRNRYRAAVSILRLSNVRKAVPVVKLEQKTS